MARRVADLFGPEIPDRAHAMHTANQAKTLDLATEHLTGLTKTFRELVMTTALLREVPTASPGAKREKPDAFPALLRLGYPASHRRIITAAVRLASAADAAELGSRRVAQSAQLPAGEAGVAERVAAVVRVAAGVDQSRTRRTRIVGIVDDGLCLRLQLSPGPGAAIDAAAVVAGADLWKQVALRPIVATETTSTTARPSAIKPHLVTPRSNALQTVRAVLQEQMEQLLSRKFGLDYDDDEEFVHEMRVATRRMRSAIRAFGSCVQGKLKDLKADLSDLADALGDVRDQDVFLLFLRDYMAEAPAEDQPVLKRVTANVRQERRTYYDHLLALREGDGWARLRKRYERQIMSPVDHREGLQGKGHESHEPAAALARKALGKRLGKVVHFDKPLRSYSAGKLHKLRIECKRLRYVGEFFEGVFGETIEPIVAPAKKMQSLLGDVHDADVYAERLEGLFAAVTGAQAQAAAERLTTHIANWRKKQLRKAVRAWNQFPVQSLRQDLSDRLAAREVSPVTGRAAS